MLWAAIIRDFNSGIDCPFRVHHRFFKYLLFLKTFWKNLPQLSVYGEIIRLITTANIFWSYISVGSSTSGSEQGWNWDVNLFLSSTKKSLGDCSFVNLCPNSWLNHTFNGTLIRKLTAQKREFCEFTVISSLAAGERSQTFCLFPIFSSN